MIWAGTMIRQIPKLPPHLKTSGCRCVLAASQISTGWNLVEKGLRACNGNLQISVGATPFTREDFRRQSWTLRCHCGNRRCLTCTGKTCSFLMTSTCVKAARILGVVTQESHMREGCQLLSPVSRVDVLSMLTSPSEVGRKAHKFEFWR